MALINCPECGERISSEAEMCIHCGYPLKQKTYIENVGYDLSHELELAISNKKIEAIRSTREKTGLGLADGKALVDYMIINKKCPSNYQKKTKDINMPHCPTCNSTDISPIDVSSRVLDTALFGVLGTKRYKTFQCNHCGYEW